MARGLGAGARRETEGLPGFLLVLDEGDDAAAANGYASVAGEVPDPQDPQTRARSTLDWSERERPPHLEVLHWYRALLALRHALPELTDGRRDELEVRVDEAAKLIIVRRGRLTLAGTIGALPARIATPQGRLELFYPEPPRRDGPSSILAPDGCAVWVQRES